MSTTGAKPRGCFQCSKRRIVCDGAEPICKKCETKGIECSGPGRIRFSAGVALRGKLRGCRIPVADEEVEAEFDRQHSTGTQPQKIRWADDRETGKRVARPSESKERKRRASHATQAHSQLGATGPGGITAGIGPAAQDCQSDCTEQTDIEEIVDQGRRKLALSRKGPITPWIAPLDARSRMYLSHFADEVAPVMVVLDEVSNGYRDILLPMACRDGLLLRAISSVAAQHLALRHPGFQGTVAAERAAVISRLRQDSLQMSPDRVFNSSTWSTLIVLLVGETITGSSEYSYLLRNLLCLAQNINQAVPSALNRFLLQQTHMFQLLGQPLLGEVQGLDTLRLHPDRYLDWMSYDIPAESKYNHVLHVSRLAFIRASEIYIGRATTNQDQWEQLESLRQLVSQVDPNEPGAHALVWVCFIAAADSTDPEHRRYFTDWMNSIFARTQFRNIPATIKSLPAIWSQQGTKRWTEDVFRLTPTLVM